MAANVLTDGFRTLITFGSLSAPSFRVKSLTPIGVESEGTIDTRTMENSRWATKAARALLNTTDMSLTVAYSPDLLTKNITSVSRNQRIFIQFPNGFVWRFWGAILSFTPSELAEGSQPEATINIVCSNQNPAGEEIGPSGYWLPAPAYGFTGSIDYNFATVASSTALLVWARSVTAGTGYLIEGAVRAPTVDGSAGFVYGTLLTVADNATESTTITDSIWSSGSVKQTLAGGTVGTAVTGWADIPAGSTISFRISATLNGNNSMRLIANLEVPVSGEVTN